MQEVSTKQEVCVSMPQFTVNPDRFDPYKQFKFRVKWDGRYIAGISNVSELKRETEVVTHRENVMRGNNPEILRQRMTNTVREYFQLIGRLGGLAGKGKPKTFKGRRQALGEK